MYKFLALFIGGLLIGCTQAPLPVTPPQVATPPAPDSREPTAFAHHWASEPFCYSNNFDTSGIYELSTENKVEFKMFLSERAKELDRVQSDKYSSYGALPNAQQSTYYQGALERFLNHEEIKPLLDKSIDYTLCFMNLDEIAFTIYHSEQPEQSKQTDRMVDETLGVVGLGNENNIQSFATTQKVDGIYWGCGTPSALKDYVIFECAGGDAGTGSSRTTAINRTTGEIKILSECLMSDGEEQCESNLLNF